MHTIHIDSIDREVFTFILTPYGNEEPWHLAGWCRVDGIGVLFKVTVISKSLAKQYSFHTVDELMNTYQKHSDWRLRDHSSLLGSATWKLQRTPLRTTPGQVDQLAGLCVANC